MESPKISDRVEEKVIRSAGADVEYQVIQHPKESKRERRGRSASTNDDDVRRRRHHTIMIDHRRYTSEGRLFMGSR